MESFHVLVPLQPYPAGGGKSFLRILTKKPYTIDHVTQAPAIWTSLRQITTVQV